MRVSGKKNMFTCCKNTFPNFNITHSHFQTFIHSFLVRWLDVSAKRKQNWKKKKKKKVQTCAQRGKMRGERFSKNAGGCSTFWGRKTRDDGHKTEGDCWRICVHLNPEREKVTNSHRNFLLFFSFFFFLTDHTSVCYALPLPTPLELWMHCERCFKSPRVVVVVVVSVEDGEGGRWGAFSHPRVKYQLWLCEHTHCAFLLANAHTHCQGNLAT